MWKAYRHLMEVQRNASQTTNTEECGLFSVVTPFVFILNFCVVLHDLKE